MDGNSGDGSDAEDRGGQRDADAPSDVRDETPSGGPDAGGTAPDARAGAAQPDGRGGQRSPGTADRPADSPPAPGDGREPLTAVLSKRTTKSQIRVALLYYAAIGAGIGLSLYSAASTLGGGLVGSAMRRFVTAGGLVSALAIGPAVGGPLGFHVARQLGDEETDRQLYATAGLGAFGGHVVMVVLVVVFIGLGTSGGGGFDVDQILVPVTVGGLGAAVAAIGAAYATLNDDGAAPPGEVRNGHVEDD
ncbi:hypothetical protein [Halosimplex marinum]|uniref:hypothetical protein n=1 Tax=Halosimplex marinum TaxID=3396620 RepID=UPI003F55E907